jgi:hypothetical protein
LIAGAKINLFLLSEKFSLHLSLILAILMGQAILRAEFFIHFHIINAQTTDKFLITLNPL